MLPVKKRLDKHNQAALSERLGAALRRKASAELKQSIPSAVLAARRRAKAPERAAQNLAHLPACAVFVTCDLCGDALQTFFC